MGRKPKSVEKRKTKYLMFELEDVTILETIQSIARQEGITIKEAGNRAIREYVEKHGPGNPQTVLSSYASDGHRNLLDVEGRARQLCLEYVSNHFGEITWKTIISILKDLNLEPKPRVAMGERVISWLRDKGIKVDR